MAETATRARITRDEASRCTQELLRLAPQRLSVPILAERLGLSREQVRRLCHLAGLDTSAPAVTRTPGRPSTAPPPKPEVGLRAARILARNEEIIRLAGEGRSDRVIAERIAEQHGRISRELVGDIRRAAGVRAVYDASGRRTGRERPSVPVADLESERVRRRERAIHLSGPGQGRCCHCRVWRPLLGRTVKPHAHNEAPCPGSGHRPLPHREDL